MKTNFNKYSDDELLGYLTGKLKYAEPAFTEIYNRYSHNITAYCVGLIKNRHDAEDIFQETFIKFYKYAREGNKIKSIRALLVATARNLCLNYLRDRLHHEEIDENIAPRIIDNTYENSEMFDIVMNLVDTLDIKYKEAFVLREIEGMAYKDIADTLEITLINAKTRVRRAKEQIIEMLEPYLNDEKKEKN